MYSSTVREWVGNTKKIKRGVGSGAYEISEDHTLNDRVLQVHNKQCISMGAKWGTQSLRTQRLLIMDDNDGAAQQGAAALIRGDIAVLTRNAARLENLAAAPTAFSSSSAVYDGLGVDAAVAQARRTDHHLGGNNQRLSSDRLPTAPQGRVDFFLTSEYHGYPFKLSEGDNEKGATRAFGGDSKQPESPRDCKVGFSKTISFTGRLPSLLVEASSPRRAKDKKGSGAKDASRQRNLLAEEEMTWFSRTAMIIGG